jgi:hypothetical protein
MRDNAKTMDTLTQVRVDQAKDMSAVDDLQSYGEIAQAHADGIKKLTPVFADLYASMSDEQKKTAPLGSPDLNIETEIGYFREQHHENSLRHLWPTRPPHRAAQFGR